jgi:hypothetical protein
VDRFEMVDLPAIGATIKLTVDALAKAFPNRLRDGWVVLLVLALAVALPTTIYFFYQYREIVYASSVTLASAFGFDVSRHWKRVQQAGDALGIDVPHNAPGSPQASERTTQVSNVQSTPYGSSDVTRGGQG